MFTSNSEIAKLMGKAASEAATAAEYNDTTESTMRASRAGLPLVQQILEDKIIKQLPKRYTNFAYSKKNPNYAYFDPQQSRIQHEMRIATGYLFEQIVWKLLSEAYPGWELSGNLELEYKGLKGHCDFVVIDHKNSLAKIVECKAIKTFSAKEACEQKLLVDNYGYYSQVSIYMAALKQMFPTYAVEGEWRVWAKRVDQSYLVKYPHTLEEAVAVAEEAMVKREHYNRVFELYNKNMIDEAATYLMDKTETLPEKIFSKGYYNASCGLHYSPWSNLIVDKYGFFLDDALDNIKEMMYCAKTKDEAATEKLLKKLDNLKSA